MIGHCEKIVIVSFVSTDEAISKQSKRRDEIAWRAALTRNNCYITPNSHEFRKKRKNIEFWRAEW
jgi:hypothetical protein